MRNNADPFELARSIAGRTSPIVTRYLHSSVLLDRKGRIIATGRNHFSGKIVLDVDNAEINKTIHSEIHCLTRVNIRRLSDAVVINYARTNVASIMARPCSNCWAVLTKLGVKKVFYTIRGDINQPTWKEEYF